MDLSRGVVGPLGGVAALECIAQLLDVVVDRLRRHGFAFPRTLNFGGKGHASFGKPTIDLPNGAWGRQWAVAGELRLPFPAGRPGRPWGDWRCCAVLVWVPLVGRGVLHAARSVPSGRGAGKGGRGRQRGRAVLALGRLGPLGAAVLERVRGLLGHEDRDVRYWAARVLAREEGTGG